MKTLGIIFAVLLLTIAAFAQGTAVDINVQSSAWLNGQKVALVIPGAKAYICSSPASGNPCTNTVALYADSGMTHPIVQPLIMNGDGRAPTFFTLAGNYQYTITDNKGNVTGPYSLSVAPTKDYVDQHAGGGINLASPPPIGSTTPNAGTFSSVTANSVAVSTKILEGTNNSGRYLSDTPLGHYDVLPSVVINAGATGCEQVVGDPWVMRVAGRFYAYTSCVATGYTSPHVVRWASDDGLSNWSGPTTVVASGSKPSIVENVCGAKYCMYYIDGSNTRINLATSPDNLTWSDYGPVLLPGGAQESSVYLAVTAYTEAGTLYLYYMGSDSVDYMSRIFLATATDGRTFSKLGKVADVGTAGAWDSGWIAPGSVLKTADGYLMSYNAGNGTPNNTLLEPGPIGIGFLYASSLTGSWTRYAGNPVIFNDSAREYSNTVWRGHIVWTGDKFRLYFNAGASGTAVEQVFVAEKSAIPRNVLPPNSIVKGNDGCFRFQATTNGLQSDPMGAFSLCARNDGSNGFSVFNGFASPVEIARFDGTYGRFRLFGTDASISFFNNSYSRVDPIGVYKWGSRGDDDAASLFYGDAASVEIARWVGPSRQLQLKTAPGYAPITSTSTTPATGLHAYPVVYDTSGAQQTNLHFVKGAVSTTTANTPVTVTLSGAAVFSGTSYVCNGTSYAYASAIKVYALSSTQISITSTSANDGVAFVCIGN